LNGCDAVVSALGTSLIPEAGPALENADVIRAQSQLIAERFNRSTAKKKDGFLYER
jgi:hypothetical protein